MKAKCDLRSPERTGAVVHSHLEVNGDAKAAIREILDTDDFRDVFAVHRIMGRGKRESDEQAHALIIVGAACCEVNAFF